MMWCVTVEILGEPARVIGPFRSEKRANEVRKSFVAELGRRDITEEIAPSVALMYPGDAWKEAVPW